METLLHFFAFTAPWGYWIALALASYCAGRFGGWPGVLIWMPLQAIFVYALDVTQMRHIMGDGLDGPDMDGPWMVGAFLNIAKVSVIMAPIALGGLWLRKKLRPRRVMGNFKEQKRKW